ncbi:MAG: transposase [Dehalococcoidia bacterium]
MSSNSQTARSQLVEETPADASPVQFRDVGIDLGSVGDHHATVLDERGEVLFGRYFPTRPEELEKLQARALKDAPAGTRLRVMLDCASMAWLPVAVWFQRRGHLVYQVPNAKTKDLREYYSKHSKSDPDDSYTLAKHPTVDAKSLVELYLPSPEVFSLERLNREHDRYSNEAAAMKNRLRDFVSFAVPGLAGALPVGLFHAGVRELLREYLAPERVLRLGQQRFGSVLRKRLGNKVTPEATAAVYQTYEWAATFYDLARTPAVSYDDLQAQLNRHWDELAEWEAKATELKKQIAERYEQVYPSQQLSSLPGVGALIGASIFATVRGCDRFPNLASQRKFFGFVPKRNQSTNTDKTGQRMTHAGPNLTKKHLFLATDMMRQHDPDVAAYYYDQMVHKGKCHTVAVCNAVNNKTIPRLHALLREDRPYELRDPQTGEPVTQQQARQIIRERYTVPEKIRRARRSHQPRRKARTENEGTRSRNKGRAQSPCLRP